MRYEYPLAKDSKSAWLQFLRDHGRRPNHCFRNIWGEGYILFDSKQDVNAWYEEHTGEYFYKEEPKPSQVFTKEDAIKEIKDTYGTTINELIAERDFSMPLLAIGLPSSTAFGNRISLAFGPKFDEEHLEWRFFVHYTPYCLKVASKTNAEVRESLIDLLYKYFYKDRFQKRIEINSN